MFEDEEQVLKDSVVHRVVARIGPRTINKRNSCSLQDGMIRFPECRFGGSEVESLQVGDEEADGGVFCQELALLVLVEIQVGVLLLL